jgi:hypothetical protein
MRDFAKDLGAIAVALALLVSSWYGLFAARDLRRLAEDAVDLRPASAVAPLPR